MPGATAVVGMAGESGFFRPESCRAAAGEKAPAESPLPHRAGHEDLPWLAELMGTGVGRDPRTAPGWDLALPGHPGQHLCSTGAGPEQCWQSRTLHLCLCPRPAPPGWELDSRSSNAQTPRHSQPQGRHSGRTLSWWGSPCCGQSTPQPQKASGTPAWPVPGVSAGAALAPRDSAGVTQGPAAPRPRQPCYRPPDSHCWAMATSQAQAGQGGPPFIIARAGTATQHQVSLFSLFFFSPSPVENNI